MTEERMFIDIEQSELIHLTPLALSWDTLG